MYILCSLYSLVRLIWKIERKVVDVILIIVYEDMLLQFFLELINFSIYKNNKVTLCRDCRVFNEKWVCVKRHIFISTCFSDSYGD